jgi:hypothetical protein
MVRDQKRLETTAMEDSVKTTYYTADIVAAVLQKFGFLFP